MSNWKIYDPAGAPATHKTALPPVPPWRQPGRAREEILARTFRPNDALVDAVNTALYLRRPLLLTGKPGTGKSALAHAVASQLCLGTVIEWAINSRSTLQEGLYQYDALARLQYIQQASSRPEPDRRQDETGELGMFLTLGPLGTALASAQAPRALLVDEIDKSDVDLPNDLLNVLDTGHFVIPELKRVGDRYPEVTISARDNERIVVRRGEITFAEYPFVVLTSNGERDFPAPFLRRCVQCQIAEPNDTELAEIVSAHFATILQQLRQENLELDDEVRRLISDFVAKRGKVTLATDQLLNAVHMMLSTPDELPEAKRNRILATAFQGLS